MTKQSFLNIIAGNRETALRIICESERLGVNADRYEICYQLLDNIFNVTIKHGIRASREFLPMLNAWDFEYHFVDIQSLTNEAIEFVNDCYKRILDLLK